MVTTQHAVIYRSVVNIVPEMVEISLAFKMLGQCMQAQVRTQIL